jgi:Rrf2 family protein
MLHISRRADYGLRLMVEIAGLGEGAVATAELARRQEVPYQFLRKVAQTLIAAGLLVSKRGSGGGLALAKPADAVTMLDIVDTLDSLDLNRCTARPPSCDRQTRCAVFPIWRELQNHIEGVLARTTLSQLATQQAKLATLASQRKSAVSPEPEGIHRV